MARFPSYDYTSDFCEKRRRRHRYFSPGLRSATAGFGDSDCHRNFGARQNDIIKSHDTHTHTHTHTHINSLMCDGQRHLAAGLIKKQPFPMQMLDFASHVLKTQQHSASKPMLTLDFAITCSRLSLNVSKPTIPENTHIGNGTAHEQRQIPM